MNDIERRMTQVVADMDRRVDENNKHMDVLLKKDLKRMSRLIESEMALKTPSCDFDNSTDRDNVHYLALFVDRDRLNEVLEDIKRTDGPARAKPVAAPHVTLAYKPRKEEVPREFFGMPFTVVIDGYGFDEENEAVRVRLQPDGSEQGRDLEAVTKVMQLLDSREKPHITLSISEGGKAVNSYRVPFHDIQPIEIGAVLGGHVDNRGKQKQKLRDLQQKLDNLAETKGFATGGAENNYNNFEK